MRRLFPSLGPQELWTPPTPEPAQLEVKGDVERRFASGGPYIVGGTPYRGNWSTEKAVSDGLERVTWVYLCCNAIASDESRLPITWKEDHPETGDEIKPDSEPLWALLNRRANKWESAQMFRYRLSIQLLLSKQGAYVELIRARDKTLKALHLLPPHRTAPIPDPDDYLAGYEVYDAAGKIYRLKPEQVLWIKKPHPLDPYMGLTPMEAAGLAVDVDFWARIYNRNFMVNDGRPGGIVNVKGFLSDEDADELEARFNGGPGRAGRVSVLESDGVEYVDTTTSARDMQHVETRQATKKEILMAFGVPETRAGDSSGRTFDNADAETEMYWRDTMRAHNDMIDQAFDTLTKGGIDDNVFTVHDTSSIYVLNRDEKDKEGRYAAEFQDGLISADEYREKTGKDPMDRPGARVLWVNNQGKMPVGEEEDEKELQEIMGGGGGAAPEEPGMGQDPSQLEPLPPLEGEAAGGNQGGGGGGGGAGAGGGAGGGGAGGNGNGGGAGKSPFSWDQYDAEDDWAVGSGTWDPSHATIKSDAGLDLDTKDEQQPVNTGIMVSLDLPERLANRFLDTLGVRDGEHENADQLHITLAYLGKVDQAPFGIDAVLEAVETFAQRTGPIALATSGIGHFSVPEGTATYASIDSPDLPSFRQRLVTLLDTNKAEVRKDHGFTPHVTLAYSPPGTPPPDIPFEQLSGQLDLLTWVAPEVNVHWGDMVFNYPLHGGSRQLANLGSSSRNGSG